MAYVVTAPCQGCKDTSCVTVCPCDCFYEGEHMLYINPEECIDCGACVPECPVEAIFLDQEVPTPWQGYIQENAEQSQQLPNIVEKNNSDWANGKNAHQFLAGNR